MSGRTRGVGRSPKKDEWIAVVSSAAPVIEEMIGKWFDSIPAGVRAELISKVYNPMIDLLVRAGLRK